MCGISECSVWRKQDPAKLRFLACRVEQVSDQPVQGRGLQTPHLVGPVLDESAAGVLLTGGWGWGGQGFPTQSDPIHNTILKFFTPFLHWILGSDRCIIILLLFIYFWLGVSQRKEWAESAEQQTKFKRKGYKQRTGLVYGIYCTYCMWNHHSLYNVAISFT